MAPICADVVPRASGQQQQTTQQQQRPARAQTFVLATAATVAPSDNAVEAAPAADKGQGTSAAATGRTMPAATTSVTVNNANSMDGDASPKTSPKAVSRRERLLEKRRAMLRLAQDAYKDHMAELFFLQSTHSVVDLPAFKKKPNPQFLNFLKSNNCPKEILNEVRLTVGGGGNLDSISSAGDRVSASPSASSAVSSSSAAPTPATPTCTSSQASAAAPPRLVGLASSSAASPAASSSSSLPGTPSLLARTLSDSRELLGEKMKQEAYVLRRVQELTKEGVWSRDRLPKLCERPVGRSHWDALLQEMQWLAVDFHQERLWKKAAAKMLAESAKEFVSTWAERRRRREEARVRQLRKRAAFMASEVRAFWRHISFLSENIKLEDLEEDAGEEDNNDTELLHNGLAASSDEELDDESTISEQERYESEHTEEQVLEENKVLALDLAQPLESLLPEAYLQDLTDSEGRLEEDGSENGSSDDDSFFTSEDDDDDSDRDLPNDKKRIPAEELCHLLGYRAPRRGAVEQHVMSVPGGMYDDYLSQGRGHPLRALAALNAGDLATRLEARQQRDTDLLFFPRVADGVHQPSLLRSACRYDPFAHFDLNSLNLVFLAHEGSLTAISSVRIRNSCAPRRLIEELPAAKPSDAPPFVPAARLVLDFHSAPGAAIGGAGAGSTRTLARSLSMTVMPTKSDAAEGTDGAENRQKSGKQTSASSPSSLAFHSESLKVIARFNERRCKGMPLYGADLISALTVVDTVRPTRSRFRGMGYVNCLNAAAASGRKTTKLAAGEIRLKTAALARLVSCPARYLNTHPEPTTARLSECARLPVSLASGWSPVVHRLEAEMFPVLADLAAKYGLPFEPVAPEGERRSVKLATERPRKRHRRTRENCKIVR